MSRKQTFGLWLLVLIPALFLGWFGLKASYEDRERTHQHTTALLQARLQDTNALIRRILGDIERQLLKRLEGWNGKPDHLQALQHKHPLVRQAFWVDAQGMLRYPNTQGPLTVSEQEFIKRTQAIWDGKAILLDSPPRAPSPTSVGQKRPTHTSEPPKYSPPGMKKRSAQGAKKEWPPLSQTSASPPSWASQQQASIPAKTRPPQSAAKKTGWGDSILDLAAGRPYGWITWYWAEGLHLLFWMRTSQAQIVGVEIDRIVLTARLVGNLPDTASQSKQKSGLLVLNNERGSPLYQWGHYPTQQPQERSLVQVALPYPLHSWQIAYFGPEYQQLQQQTGRILFQQIALWASVLLVLLLLAFYLYREFSRDMREAAQRVNFVTQVSHELKTPLTNIRLYAELLENRIPPEDTRSRRHIHVIVLESQRLSRLIHNILTFSRQHRKQHKIHVTACSIDDVIAHTLEQFSATLQAKGIAIETDLQAPSHISIDPDAVEQILNNLLSNVEKYAVSGHWVSLRSTQDLAGNTSVYVEDRGPGIPSHLQEQVFLPFVRGSDKLSDGVTGTGIGLTIARELARMHQGDLVLQNTTTGACFALLLPNTAHTTQRSEIANPPPTPLPTSKDAPHEDIDR